MKTATIETIAEVINHPNADRLDIVKVQGWQCVVRRGEFAVGQRVVFIPIDTILPEAPWSEFLKNGSGRIRLKTVKLRGEFSQGLVLPLDVLPPAFRRDDALESGVDVGPILGVTKYEKELHGPSSAGANLSGNIRCTFPTHLVSKTDEDNALSNKRQALHVLSHDCVGTIKLDGSSCTIIVENGEIQHVCSRNMSLEPSDTNSFWRAARYGVFPAHFSGVIQGELMGPGVQGNQLELAEHRLYVYQIRVNGQWLCHQASVDLANQLGFEHVWSVVFTGGTDIGAIQRFADQLKLPNGKPAEGIVVRPVGTPSSGIGRPLGVKFINRNYDIKH